MGPDGCAARVCAPDEALDIASGACAPRAGVRGAPASCPDAAVVVDRRGAAACLRSADTCPHGTRREGERCARPPACPPGTLPESAGCRAFVSAGAGPSTAPRVDVGAWAAIALGIDGGPGSDDLCRDVARRADAFDLEPGETRSTLIHIALTIPDQDTTRASATVHLQIADGANGSPGPAPPAAGEVVERAVASRVEPFRGLGGEASTAGFEVAVHCDVTSR